MKCISKKKQKKNLLIKVSKVNAYEQPQIYNNKNNPCKKIVIL